MNSNEDHDKVHTKPLIDSQSQDMEIDNKHCDEEFIGDESDSEITDMETLIAQVNERDPNVRTQIIFNKEKITFQTLDEELSREMSETSLDSTVSNIQKEVVDNTNSGVHHHHDHEGAPCECKESKHVLASEQEVKAISAAEQEWKEAISKFSQPYEGNSFGLKGSDRLNLAQSLGVAPTSRKQTEHEYAASLQARGKKARRRRQTKKSVKGKAIAKKVSFITNLDQLMWDLNRCKNGCFHEVDLTDEEWKSRIIVRSSTIMNMKTHERASFFKEAIMDNIRFSDKHPTKGKGRFKFATLSICPHCFYQIHACSRTRYYGYVKAVKDGLRYVDDPKVRARQKNVTFNFEREMTAFFDLNGEKYPQHETINLTLTTTKAIFHELKEKLVKDQVIEPKQGAYSTFIKIWKKKFSHVVIPNQPRMGKCKVCVQFQEAIEKTSNAGEKQSLREQRRLHYDHVTREREVYWDVRRTAARHNSKHCSAVLDGMDFRTTSLPVFPRKSKIEQDYEPFKKKVTGGMMHGMPVSHFLFVTDATIPGDTNLNIHAMSRMCQVNKSHLKKVWVIQLDNTGAGNKTVKLMAFLGMLVQYQVFDEVCHDVIVNILHRSHDSNRLLSTFYQSATRMKISTRCFRDW